MDQFLACSSQRIMNKRSEMSFPEWKTISWVLIYQWIQKVRVVFHGCVTLCVCILNFACHLLPCHIKSAIKWYSQASWTASCYQNRLSHSAFPLCFHLIPGCAISVPFCHWCDLSESQFNSLSQDKSWGFFAKSLLIFLITSLRCVCSDEFCFICQLTSWH